MASPSQAPKGMVLNSWKEIACYLGRGVRTVQRYERDLALPVRRPRGKSRSAVIAMPEDLDAWLRRAPIGDLNAIDAATAQDTPDEVSANANELRNRCYELCNAHLAAMSKLQSNLAVLQTEVEFGKAVRECNGVELLAVPSPLLPQRHKA